jgi:hypothetical protein
MLFDLSSPRRKTAVRIIFGGLAALFAISFIGFGIGSDATGGIFDALGLGGDDTTENPQFQEDIDKAKADLAADPKDEGALLRLAEASMLAGNDEVETDEETGAPVFTDASLAFYDDARGAWEDYLALDPKKPDDAIGAQILGVYINSFNGLIAQVPPDIPEIRDTLDGAVAAAEVVAERQPSTNSYGTLAQYAYLAGDDKVAEEAGRSAVAEAEGSEKESIEKFVAEAQKVGADFQKRLEKAEKAEGGQTPEEAFGNPLEESLGGGGITGTPPAPPPAP